MGCWGQRMGEGTTLTGSHLPKERKSLCQQEQAEGQGQLGGQAVHGKEAGSLHSHVPTFPENESCRGYRSPSLPQFCSLLCVLKRDT